MPKVNVTVRSEVKLRLKSGLSNNSKNTSANLKKLHQKIKCSEKVCHTHDLGSTVTFKEKATIRGQKSNHFSAIT